MSRGMKLVLRDPRRQNKDQRHEVSCRERNFINFLVAWYSNTPQFTTHFTIERDLGHLHIFITTNNSATKILFHRLPQRMTREGWKCKVIGCS